MLIYVLETLNSACVVVVQLQLSGEIKSCLWSTLQRSVSHHVGTTVNHHQTL